MTTTLRLLFLATSCLCSVAASAADSIDAEVIFRGTFRPPFERPSANDPPPPKINFGFGWVGPRPRQETNSVVGTKGLDFGVLFIPHAPSPKGAPIKLRYVIRFPELGQVKPGFPATTHAESEIECLVGLVCTARYVFDADWEIVQGRWRFEVFSGETKILEQAIDVQAPPPSVERKPNEV